MSFLKLIFTGVPSSSPPAFPRFFPALSLALFFARAPLSERLEQAIIKWALRAKFDERREILSDYISKSIVDHSFKSLASLRP